MPVGTSVVLAAVFMVSKAADAAVWEDLKDIRPPVYDGTPSTSTASWRSWTIGG